MRTVLVGIFLIFFAISSLILLPLTWLLDKMDPKLAQRFTQQMVRIVFGIVLFLSGVKKTVIGVERIPRDRAVLFAINHRGFFDVILALNTVPILASFVAKKELNKIYGLRLWMRALNCAFIDRKNPREGLKAILKGIENIKNGTSMFISPEGTRNKEAELLPFKPGSLKMAEKTGCPIIPVAITNADEVFENHIPWIRGTKMTIEYGEPIFPEELSTETKTDLYELARNRVQFMLEKNA